MTQMVEGAGWTRQRPLMTPTTAAWLVQQVLQGQLLEGPRQLQRGAIAARVRIERPKCPHATTSQRHGGCGLCREGSVAATVLQLLDVCGQAGM